MIGSSTAHLPGRHARMIPLLALLASVACAHPGRLRGTRPTTVILDVTVVDVTTGEQRANQMVVVAEGRIAFVARSDARRAPRGARAVQGNGGFLIPGLIDTHVHLGDAWARTSADTITQLARILASGVTTVRDMLSDDVWARLGALNNAQRAGALVSPRILRSAALRATLGARRAGVDADASVAGVKLVNAGRDSALAVIAGALRAGWLVFGHASGPGRARGEFDYYVRDAVEAGISGVSHIQSFLHPWEQEGVAWAPPPATARERTLAQLSAWKSIPDGVADRLVRAMIAREVWLEPTLAAACLSLALAGECEIDLAVLERHQPGMRRPPAGDSALQRARREYYAAGEAFVRRFASAGGLIIAGTDDLPSQPLGVAQEVRLLVRTGLTPLRALQAATVNAARALGLPDAGVIAAGAAADLVLLDASPLADPGNLRHIRGVMAGGRYFDAAALDGLRRVGLP